MLGTSRAAALAVLVLTGSTMLEPAVAWAAPPDPQQTPPAVGFQAPGPVGPVADKPSLIKELPWAAYATVGVSSIVGAVLNVFGANAANELKDPSQHTTPDQTHSLVVKARVGEVISGVMFVFTGASTVWGTISTVRAVMKISAAVKQQLPPVPVGVSVAPLPGGVAMGIGGRF